MDKTSIDLDEEFDFGFTTVSEDIFQQAEAVVQDGAHKAEAMYKAVLPLLNNLIKDADKNAYIHWPNRAEKIEAFKKRLLAIVNS